MWLIWWVIDNDDCSKTSHVLAVASFWLRELIKNLSCAWYGELLITCVDQKLVMCLIWRVIDYVSGSKTRHVFDMASYRLREWIENSSCAWNGELLITFVDQKLVTQMPPCCICVQMAALLVEKNPQMPPSMTLPDFVQLPWACATWNA